MHILDLPAEILSAILSWVPCNDLVLSVPLVCKYFRDLLITEWYWRRRFVGLTAAQPLKVYKDLVLQQWQAACLRYEDVTAEQKTITLSGPIGGVDCVHILHPSSYGTGAVIVAGSRDSLVYIWRRRSSPRDMRSFTSQKLSGHKGWVWCLASEPGRESALLCSGSWDHTINIWDIAVGQNIASIKKEHKSVVLSLTMPQPNQLVSTCQDKRVREIDLRQPIGVTICHTEHTQSVLSVAANERFIYSGSEDKSVCVWDRRAHKLLQRIKLKKFIPSLCLDSDLLTLASGQGVNVYDARNGTLDLISSFVPEHSLPLTSVLHTLGTVATASKDGTVRLHSMAEGHRAIATLNNHRSDVTSLDFSKRTLAIASADTTVSLCSPKLL
ncbi:F-box/WD repeat-containing protein 9-like [Halichondria panicea]|uniref:F-box/WD repeat-containing protein 9-like n=1 Tax=Halichondria panicea TaxID=6063 RepID=UPI00312BC0EE